MKTENLNKRIFNLTIYLVVIIIIVFGVYFFCEQINLAKKNPEIINQKEVETTDIVSKVSRLYLLPNNEKPTVATVSNPEVLKGQSLFNSAQKGDKVLIFSNLGKAVLYRPSIDKIIEITPIKSDALSF